MAKFLVLYRSPVTAADQMQQAADDPAAAAAEMQKWMDWQQRAGAAILDMGSPVQSVAGPSGGDAIGGYTVMEAESLEALQEHLEGHPHTEWGGSIEVLEFLALPDLGDNPAGE